MATPREVAAWMVDEFKRGNGFLPQKMAAFGIKRHFGEDFTYWNKDHSLAIAPTVLAEFRRLTGKEVVWERRGNRWRRRQPFDPPGRMVP